MAFTTIRSLLQVVLRAFRGINGPPSGVSPNPPPDRATAHVTMYARDAVTGQKLWISGDPIAATNHFSGMPVVYDRAYVGTDNGIV